jgi:hypothetical protein
MKIFFGCGYFQFYAESGSESAAILGRMGFVFDASLSFISGAPSYYCILIGADKPLKFFFSNYPKNTSYWENWEIIPTKDLEQTLKVLLL